MDQAKPTKSVPVYFPRVEERVDTDENDLRFRRTSQAAILAQLPSRQAFYSEAGITLGRRLSCTQRRKSELFRKESVLVGMADEEDDEELVLATRRVSCALSISGGMKSKMDQWERRQSIKDMVASIDTKRKYR